MKPLPQLHGVNDGDTIVPPCLDRRAFLANSGLLAVGALLASACGDGQIGGAVNGPPVAGNETVTIRTADYATLATVGGIARLTGTTRPIALVRSGASAYRAFSMICTHEGTTIEIVNGSRSFRCPNHGAEFASTGVRTGGQVTNNLIELPVTVDAATGAVTVRY